MPEAISLDDVRAARKLGLKVSRDCTEGLQRVRKGKAFVYRTHDGRPVTDEKTLARIRSLVIPPAWTDVWICTDAHGHLQATGRDAKGRKQYRYHPHWRAHRERLKFGRMVEFGTALHTIRLKTAAHLRERGLGRTRVLAAIVTLLERTLIRVGNEEYARSNHHYGLTTLRNSHVTIDGARLVFDFVGKSGKRRTVELVDRQLAKLLAEVRALPGRALFQWVDEHGQRHRVTSGDVNSWLREVSGTDFTAKNFRTWAATVMAAEGLGSLEAATQALGKKAVVSVVRTVSERLGNTPTVCRKSYIHPHVIEAFSSQSLRLEPGRARRQDRLSPSERAVLALLSMKAHRAMQAA